MRDSALQIDHIRYPNRNNRLIYLIESPLREYPPSCLLVQSHQQIGKAPNPLKISQIVKHVDVSIPNWFLNECAHAQYPSKWATTGFPNL